MELQSAVEEIKKLTHDIRDNAEKQGQKLAAEFGGKAAEFSAKVDKFDADAKERHAKMTERIDQLEVKLKERPPVAGATEEKAAQNLAVRKAMNAYLRKGKEALGPEEIKVLQTSDDTQAGYLAPAEYVQEIIKASLLFSPVRSVARIMTTSQRDVEIPVRTATFAATWASEAATKSETTGLKYGLAKIPAHELYAEVHVTNQMLEDSAFNLESELNMEFGEQFGIAEGTAFVNGTGIGKPRGFMDSSVSGTKSTTSGTSADFSFDDIYNTLYALKPPYQAAATWMAANATIGKIRLLKDGQARYLWEPSNQAGQPSTLCGRPILEATDMPATGVSSNKPIVVGAFQRAYRIVDRTQVVLLRDPYTLATNGQVKFLARRRVGGDVVLAEAISILTLA